ncbi:IcmF-related protein [hydrothermal vent metagenome]|uniref:IcmF-related protein n=1 Tax=hydrothermal vent metagenome TaxID=652676 RepID=A0A3B0YJX3_9ZZZZ
MKRLIQILTQKWFISAIGITALIILIWFGGPYLGIGDSRPLGSPFNRLLALLAVIVVWGLNNFRLRFKATQANSEMIDNLISAPPAPSETAPDVSAEEVALLRERFEEALKHLKHTSLQGRLFGKQYLYELPWYIIIGPPGCGKTTLLENSGLEFPLDEYKVDKKISGVGGTRNCDWWFTNEAVLLDTAGRYTTQDSNAEADSGAWLGFLELLQKQRPRRPLNGIIVAISAEDILTKTQQERDLHAHTIRQRIQEVYTHLGIRVPIYFLLTKLDLVAGFMEFYDDLGKEQRAQVWGITFPQDTPQQPADVLQLFSGEFDALVKSLNSRQLWRMYQERDLARRSLINGFPQQIAGIKPLLEDFLQKIFSPSRYEQRPLLRGVYFTSGTQQGSPIDRVMGSLAGSLGLNLQALPSYQGQSRNYFITRIFKDILFKESEMAGSNVRYEKQRLWLERAAYAGTIGITLVMILIWSASFTRSELKINKLENKIENYNKAKNNLQPQPRIDEIINTLQAAKDISRIYETEQDTSGWQMGMGSYQNYKLGNAAENAYHRTQQQLLLPYIKQSLEYKMRDTSQEPEELRRLLSVYLMLGNPETLDARTFRPWVTSSWQQQLADQPNKQARLTAHLDELLKTELTPQTLDQRLMDRTQRIVCQIPLTRQIYARLKQQADADIRVYNLARLSKQMDKQVGRQIKKILTSSTESATGADTSASMPAGPISAGSISSDTEIPGFYTYDGYHTVLNKEGERTTKLTIAENRTICEQNREELERADPERLLRDVRARYFDDYVDQWNNFLATIELNKIRNINGAVNTLNVLSARESPLEAFVRAIAEQTILQRAQLKGLLDRFDLGKKLTEPNNPVEQAFLPLHKLLQSEDDQPSDLQDLHQQLQDLYAYITDISEASDQTTAAFEAAVARMTQNNKDAIRKLRSSARRLPSPLARIVESAATQSWGAVLGSARAYINTVWRSSVLREYQTSLENRYPVYKKGRQQTALVDFGRFFGASGSIDNFINTYLTAFVDTRRWRQRSVDGRSLGLSAEAMLQIQRAARIRKMYFQDGGQLPAVRFRLKPIYLDAGVKRFFLELNGQQLSYQHGPQRTTKLEWPGIDDNNRVRLIFERFGAGRFSIVKDGPWAWFKLLDSSTIGRTRSADQIQVTFSTAGLKARYQIQASSITNPFTNRELAKFRCPKRL